MEVLATIGVLWGVSTSSAAFAQSATALEPPTCALDALDPPSPLNEDDFLDRQKSLASHAQVLTNRLKALSADDVADRRRVEEEIELNRIALSYVQEALELFAKLQSNIADCESALKRWTLVSRIDSSAGNPESKQAALAGEKAIARKKLTDANKANKDLSEIGPILSAYANLSLSEANIVPVQNQQPNRQANVEVPVPPANESGDCAKMIAAPRANLEIGECRGNATIRSARQFAGGDVAFPSSVLTPRGLAANLAGSSSDGTVSVTFADSFRFRRTADPNKALPANEGDRVQLPWEFGYSIGVKAKDGVLFSRDDVDDRIRDNIGGQTIVSGGLFFNVYESESLGEWNARATKLTNAAVTACREEQSGGESKKPSTCAGQSLTEWVYALKEDGSLLHPELAQQADDLYFLSKDDRPVWGGGVNVSLSRGNFNFLDPEVFIADPTTKNETDGGWNYETTAFAYGRLNPSSPKWDVSLIGSLSRSSVFGYPEGTKTRQFCPAITSGTAFVTSGCPSYYTAPPERIASWTPAAELRILTKSFGPLPSFGISPKVSYQSIQGSTADRWRIAVPALAFVDKEAGLGVGIEYSREWGGVSDQANANGVFEELDEEDQLKIIVSKTFSLTGL